MKLVIIGTGYVGLVTGACLAETGHTVYCIDTNKKKIDGLNKGVMPIFEPGLEDLVVTNHKKGRLHFLTNLPNVLNEVDVVFLAVGTPPKADYSADLSAVIAVSKDIGQNLSKPIVVVTKSTVPVGTSDLVFRTISENLKQPVAFEVASNPEFLREGAAIKDFLEPDRIIIGVSSKKAEDLLSEVYRYFIQNDRPFIVTSIKSAEVIKYASNAFLATKLSFINEIANFCEVTGAVIDDVTHGMGYDSRIGHKYLHAGLGYGGSCFPKDVKALIATGKTHSCDFKLLEAVENVNNAQRLRVIMKLRRHYRSLKGKKIAIWGLAFKAKTDDVRESPALTIIDELEKRGVAITVYDPVVKFNRKDITVAENMYDCCNDAHALLILTEWEDFMFPDFNDLKSRMRKPIIIDGRNLYQPADMISLGWHYDSIGRPL